MKLKSLANPFKFGQTVEKTSFFDRALEVESLQSDFSNSQNVILMAPRRYGKSSLIKKVMAGMQKQGYLCLYVDLFRAHSVSKMVQLLSEAFITATQTPLKKIVSFLKLWVPKLKPTIVIKGDELPEISFDWERVAPKNDGQKISQILQGIYKYTQQKKLKAIITLDEFQEIMEWGNQQTLKELRAVIQTHENIAYCFAGSKRHLLSELFIEESSPFYHSGKILSLKRIPYQDFFNYLVKEFRKIKLPNLKAQIEGLLTFTGCHPYYTQMLGYYLWERTRRGESGKFEDAIEQVLQFQNDAYTSLWDRLTQRQRKLLVCISYDEEAPLTQASTINKWDLGSPATVFKSIKALEENGTLEKLARQAPQFSDPFFKKWVRRL